MAHVFLTAKIGTKPSLRKSGSKYILNVFLIEKQGYYAKDGKWVNDDNKFFASMFFDKEESAVKVARSLLPHENYSLLLELSSYDVEEKKTSSSLVIKEFNRVWANSPKKDSAEATKTAPVKPNAEPATPAPNFDPIKDDGEIDF